MEYLSKEKINLHLKLGRELFQFVGLGENFESKTFEYLSLTKRGDEHRVKLVRALDYLYSISPNMSEFELVEESEGERKSVFTGSLEDCIDWSAREHNCSNEKWSLDLIEVYISFVNRGKLGQNRD